MDGSPPRSPGPGPHGGRGTVVGTKYNTAENGYALLIRGNTDGTEITYSVQNGSAAHSVMADGMVTLHQQVDVLTIRGQPETAHTIIFWSRSIPPQVLATLTATHYQPMTADQRNAMANTAVSAATPTAAPPAARQDLRVLTADEIATRYVASREDVDPCAAESVGNLGTCDKRCMCELYKRQG
jgi:hypothetical protein